MSQILHAYDNVERKPCAPVVLDDGSVISCTLETRSIKVRLNDGSLAIYAQMTVIPDEDRPGEEWKDA